MNGSQPNNLAGRRFGRLTVLGISPRADKSGRRYWRVRCDCGCEVLALGSDMARGKSRSCGCLRREIAAAIGRITGPVNAPRQNRLLGRPGFAAGWRLPRALVARTP